MTDSTFGKLTLWKIWLILFIICLHIYMIYTTIRDYIDLKILSIDPAYGSEWTSYPMNFQLNCLLCSLTLLPLIILLSLLNTGNLANDGHMLGQDIDNNQFIFDSDSRGRFIRFDPYNSKKVSTACIDYSSLKQQFLPLSVFLQIIAGFCYLLPLPFIEAQKIKYKAVRQNQLWHTDLDFLINPDKDHPEFTNNQNYHYHQAMRSTYFNMIFTLSLLTFRYPTVFWRTSSKFCLLFCIELLLLSFHILIDYSSTSILIRLACNPEYISTAIHPIYSPSLLCFLSTFGSLILLFVQICFFSYGLDQYFHSLARYRQTLRLQFKEDCSKKSQEKENNSNSSESTEIDASDDSSDNDCQTSCRKYLNLISAFMFGIIGIGMKIPILLCNSTIYSITGDRIMHINIIFTAVFGVFWLFTWFGLSLHGNWNFQVSFPDKNNLPPDATIAPSSSLPTTSTALIPLDPPGSPVYATCHAVNSALGIKGISPHHPRKSFESYDGTDISSSYNYVFLHNANNPVSISENFPSFVPNYSTVVGRQGIMKPKGAISPTTGNADLSQFINSDELFGSEKSYGSNISRTLTIPEKTKYILLSQENTDTMTGKNKLKYYYSLDNPNSKRDSKLATTRSPLLSYQMSVESSPLDSQNRRHMSELGNLRVTFKDPFELMEPDIISHRITNVSNESKYEHITENVYDPVENCENPKSLTSDGLFPEKVLFTNYSNGFERDKTIIANQVRNQKPMTNNPMLKEDDVLTISLNPIQINNIDESIEEEERLCSQV